MTDRAFTTLIVALVLGSLLARIGGAVTDEDGVVMAAYIAFVLVLCGMATLAQAKKERLPVAQLLRRGFRSER